MRRISELPIKEFNAEDIDNSVFVVNPNTIRMSAIPISSIFEFIKKKAKDDGLEVELQENKIIFKPYKTTLSIIIQEIAEYYRNEYCHEDDENRCMLLAYDDHLHIAHTRSKYSIHKIVTHVFIFPERNKAYIDHSKHKMIECYVPDSLDDFKGIINSL